ncbi:MAG: endonuclease/exonuclease/phosphatase family protein [Akkermansia sp.]|nr:endonuclease/exonuclease/phosphatase family protein [Akkermansia sp.]
MRADVALICLVLVAAALLQQLCGGGDSLMQVLTGEPAAVQTAPDNVADAAQAQMAHEALEPEIACEGMPEPGEPVRFVMQNVQNYFVAGEQQRSRYVLTPKSAASREAVAEGLARMKPDIIGLVEIGGPVSLQDLRARLEQRGLCYPFYRVLVRQGEDRALGILSRYPIVADASAAQMPLFGSGRRVMLRGVLDVTVRTEDGRLFRFLGAHLKSRVADDPAAAAALREKEAHTLAARLQAEMRRNRRMPVLVFGDWNDTPDDPAVRLMVQGLSKDAALKRLEPRDLHGEEWTLYYSRAKSYLVFDHLFVNNVLYKRMGGRKLTCGIAEPPQGKGSDHRALWCELK